MGKSSRILGAGKDGNNLLGEAKPAVAWPEAVGEELSIEPCR